jgi:thiamine pyrophosphate-dependent acetolactate synthase large subunit-like protein
VLSGAESELAEFAAKADAMVATTISGQGSLAETDRRDGAALGVCLLCKPPEGQGNPIRAPV